MLDAMIFSPPWAETASDSHCDSSPERFEKLFAIYKANGGGMGRDGYRKHLESRQAGYGTTQGQIGSLKQGELVATTGGTAACELLSWQNCYDDNWNGLITDDSFQHPAKMARGLLERIIAFGLARGYWKRGDVIGDPFGGVGTTGIIGATNGLKVVSVELEPRFFELAKKNYALHQSIWQACGDPQPVILNGDSRKFAELVGGITGCVTSPPFQEMLAKVSKNGIGSDDYGKGDKGGIHIVERRTLLADLNHSEFGAYLKARRESLGFSKAEMDRRIGTNTAYSFWEGRMGSADQFRVPLPTMYRKLKEILDLDGRFDEVLLSTEMVEIERRALKMGHTEVDYGQTPGQIGSLATGNIAAVLTSPPYAESVKGAHGETETAAESQALRVTPGGSLGASQRHGGYGVTDGQVGALKEGVLEGVVTSPPFMSSTNRGAEDPTFAHKFNGPQNYSDESPRDPMKTMGGDRNSAVKQQERAERASQIKNVGEIVASSGATGLLHTETYWQAMKVIYQQCHEAIRPQGVLVVVIKDYVSKKQRVPLCEQTCTLLEAVGFRVETRVRTMLVKESVEADLFGADVTKRKERKSFFRRLAEKKGSPRIDWEEVLIARRLP